MNRFLIVVLLFVGGCSSENSGKIIGLIPEIDVTAGVPETLLLSDLYFAADYDIEIKSTDKIAVVYQPKINQIEITVDENFAGLTQLPFVYERTTYQIPIRSNKLATHTFTYKPALPVDDVNVIASFNGWDRSASSMIKSDDGSWEHQVQLNPGTYYYQFSENKDDNRSELPDPENDQKVSNGFGSFNSVLTILDQNPEKSDVHLLGSSRLSPILSVRYQYEVGGVPTALSSENIVAFDNNQILDPAWISMDEGQIGVFSIDVPFTSFTAEQNIRLSVSQDHQATPLKMFTLFNGQPAGGFDVPETHRDMIIYSLMTDRFSDGDESINAPVDHPEIESPANFQGGDWQGIINKIEDGYFDQLGINTLWISPVNQNPAGAFPGFKENPDDETHFYAGYHGYWPTSARETEPHYGSSETLKNLIAVAHQKGIKILFDFVSNHVHEQHPYYQNHPEWFVSVDLPDGTKNFRRWDEYRLTTWFDSFLPTIDYQNSPEALEQLTDDAIWWLKEYKVDGFRHDAVKHVPNIFWRELTRKIRTEIEIPEGRKVYQIGETFGDYNLIKSYVNNGQLSAQFNFEQHNAALATFLSDQGEFVHLDAAVKKGLNEFGYQNVMSNLMDNHDKVRVMTFLDGDMSMEDQYQANSGWDLHPKVDHTESYARAQQFLAYVMTVPGIPAIYYGNEIGLSGAGDPDNRRMMRFDENLSNPEAEMLSEIQKIVQLRRNHSALRYGDFVTLLATKDHWAFTRTDLNESVLIIMNKSDTPATVEIPLPEWMNADWVYTNTETNQPLTVVNDVIKVDLPAFGSNVYGRRME